tara:strand:- start:269 stop:619 length:351 start_codon:yes stop_codon:yes gene_type:complete
MAEKKVLTNMNLIKIILSFAGVEIKRECNVCGMVIKYQILNQEIENNHRCYINLETCEKKYFCNDECLNMYKQRYNNERFCTLLFLILVIIGLLLCLLVVLFEGKQTSAININLSV